MEITCRQFKAIISGFTKLFRYDFKPTSLIIFADIDELLGIEDKEDFTEI